MEEMMETRAEIFPAKYKVLSGSVLKLIAVVTMLVDHVAYAFPAVKSVVLVALLGKTITLYTIMRLIGRLAFPIFAFLLVEGFLHTSDRVKYGASLLAFALISEIPWNLFNSGKLFYASQNVFFTLFLGYLGIFVYEKFKKDKGMMLALLALLVFASAFLRCDYGAKGFALIMILYFLRDEKPLMAVCGTGILAGGINTFGVAAGFATTLFYNGERGFIRGKVLKYCFYAIYPIHMLLIYLLK